MHVWPRLRFTLLGLALGLGAAACGDDIPDDFSIVDALAAADQYGTTLTALETAGLAEALRTEGPFTLFAPTDAAWDALPSFEREGLLADSAALRARLLFHLTPFRWLKDRLDERTFVETVGQDTLYLTHVDGIRVNGVRIVEFDLEGANGVAHGVETLLTR